MKGTLGLVVLGASLLGVGLVGYQLAQRVGAFNATLPTPFHFDRAFKRHLVFDGGPFKGLALRVDDAWIGEGDARRPALEILWGPADAAPGDPRTTRRLLPVIAPEERREALTNMRDLDLYADSVAVLSFAPVVRGELDDADTRSIRMVLVARRSDFDPNTWGAVRVRDWYFELIEFLPDGTTRPPADLPPRLAQFPAPRDPQGRAPILIERPDAPVETIVERSWEWQAALHAVPKGQVSRYRFKTTAVQAMGWTLPAAGGLMLSACLGLGLFLGARVRQPTS